MLVESARRLIGGENLTVVHGDCLTGKHNLAPALLAALRPGGAVEEFRLVANLPYGAATPLLSTLLMSHPECRVMAVTVQKEAADRVMAAPRSKEYGPLAVISQALCRVEKIATIRPECFWPRPDVTSSMILLTRLEQPMTSDVGALSDTCRQVFAHRRKQIRSALKGIPLPEGIRPTMRAEELSVVQLINLARSISNAESGRVGLDSRPGVG
jgi:16S rRNA (adenine1518-N6/adenine1519-N6)-dimethyltransferase